MTARTPMLTSGQVAAFERDGFLIATGLLGPERVRDVSSWIDEIASLEARMAGLSDADARLAAQVVSGVLGHDVVTETISTRGDVATGASGSNHASGVAPTELAPVARAQLGAFSGTGAKWPVPLGACTSGDVGSGDCPAPVGFSSVRSSMKRFPAIS